MAGDKPTAGSRALGGDPGERAPPSGAPAGTLVCSPLPNQLAQSHFPQGPGASEAASHQPAHLLVQPLSHPFPKNTLPESPKVPPAETLLPEAADGPAGSTGVMLVPPADSASVSESHKAGPAGGRGSAPGALDSPLSRPLDAPLGAYSPAQPDGPASCQQSGAGHPRPPGPGPRSPDHFYQQVTSDAPSQPPNPGSPPALGQPPNPARPPASPAPADVGPQPPPPRPPRSSSASVVSSSSSQAAARSDPQWLPPPPPDLTSHYYFRSLYEGFPPPYACPYPLDPGAAPHYQVGSGARASGPLANGLFPLCHAPRQGFLVVPEVTRLPPLSHSFCWARPFSEPTLRLPGLGSLVSRHTSWHSAGPASRVTCSGKRGRPLASSLWF